MRGTRVRILTAILVLAACSDNEPAGPNGSNDFISATVNGTSWAGTQVKYATYVNQGLTVSGTSAAGQEVRISLANITAVGTYSLSSNNPNAAIANVIEGGGASIWASNIVGGNGTFTLTTFSLTRMAGSFTFGAVPATAAATGVKTVANGSFDLPL